MKKLSTCLIVLFCGFTMPAIADDAGPSFDCVHTRSAQEDIICDHVDLSEMDLKLYTTYQALLQQLPTVDAAQLKDDQAAWIKRRNKTCKRSLGDYVDGCLREAYIARQNMLNNMARTFNVAP